MGQKISTRRRRNSSLVAGTFSYTIYVKTGDIPESGTDANIYVILHSGLISSRETKLDVLFRDDFERGQLDKFKIKYQLFSDIDKIEIWRDNSGFKDDWYVDTILVVNEVTKVQTVFPIYRWIRANFHYFFTPNDTSLPYDDDYKAQRQLELTEKRKIYELVVPESIRVPQMRSVPVEEAYADDHLWNIVKTRTRLKLASKIVHMSSGRMKRIEDIHRLFNRKAFPQPSNLDRWKSDEAFGLQRLAGVHNTAIWQCKQLPGNLAVTNDMVAPFLEGHSLPLALSDRRIFIINHDILDGCPTIDGTTVCSPIALFYQRNDGTLVPIAIQLFQKAGEDNPVFLPSDPLYTWTAAKLWFNNADACVHQAVHLGVLHMLMEGIAVITHRNISRSHPVFKLLAPHIRSVIAVNAKARERLINSGGWVDLTMSIGAKGLIELAKNLKSSWRMDIEGTFPVNCRNRGLGDSDILPDYHFKQDALEVYDAIWKYVRAYVYLYYESEQSVRKDIELQTWREEMVKPETDSGLGLLGVPGQEDQFTCRSQLVLVLVSIIFTASVDHAAANYKQYDEYAFLPNYPTRLSGEPPKSNEEITEEQLVEMLPEKEVFLNAMIITKILSVRCKHRPLGYFDTNLMFDQRAVKILRDFREDLKTVGASIKTKNKTRKVPYQHLDPAVIPNGICV